MTVFPVGTHCILELHGCPFELLNDETSVRNAVRRASQRGMSTLLQLSSHQFQPYGVTALALLAESHISVHTWPEHGYAAVDLFTCGETAQPRVACAFLVDHFQARDHELKILTRGARAVARDEYDDARDEEGVLCQAPN